MSDYKVNEATIAKKAELVDVFAEKFEAATSIVVASSRGLTVEQDTQLRKELREAGVEFKVVKTQSCVVQLKSWTRRFERQLRRPISSSYLKRRCYCPC